jgi:hypothetical protein
MPRKAKDSGEVKLVRRMSDGKIEARARGRAPAGAVNGYVDASGNFTEGNPRKNRRKGKRGRPAGVKNQVLPKTNGKSAAKGGLSQIEQIVQREVDQRLKAAAAAAIQAISDALA